MTSYAEQRAYWKGFLATAPVPARAKLVYSDLGESKNIVARGKWTIVLYAICYMLSSKKSHESFLTRYIKIWLLHFIITFRDQLKVQRMNSLREVFFLLNSASRWNTFGCSVDKCLFLQVPIQLTSLRIKFLLSHLFFIYEIQAFEVPTSFMRH